MRNIVIAALLFSTPAFAGSFGTVPEYQNDFDKATLCKPVNGRMVWKGEFGFYIQSTKFYTSETGQVAEDAASVIPYYKNTKDTLRPFYKACE